MLDGDEAFDRLAPDFARRAVVGGEIGMSLFQRDQPLHQLVVIVVGDDGRGVYVIERVVVTYRGTQRFDLIAR